MKLIASFLFVLMPFGFAVAQDIPLPLLESDRKSCKASCEKSYSGKQCNQLCDCTVSEMQKKVSFDLYLQLTAEVSQGQLSKENTAMMGSIAQRCSTRIFNKLEAEAATLEKVAPKPKQ